MVLRCPLDALALGLPFRCKVSHHLQTAPFYLAPVTEWYANVSLSGCEVAQRGQDEIRGQLQLVLCMLPLSERYGLCRGQMQFVSEIKGSLKHEEPFVWESHLTYLGWAVNVTGARFHGVSRTGLQC